MSNAKDHSENFLQRWSRRKRAAEAAAHDGAETMPREAAGADADAVAKSAIQDLADLPAFDPKTLPAIDSITATSDIRAFLAPGVPEELKRAALRRVWTADPAIRDFIGVAESQWDFNKPDSIPGFGSLTLSPELSRMVAGLFGDASLPATPPPLSQAERREQAQAPEISAKPPAAASAQRASDAKAQQSMAQQSMAQPLMAQPLMAQPSTPQPSMAQPSMVQPSMAQPSTPRSEDVQDDPVQCQSHERPPD